MLRIGRALNGVQMVFAVRPYWPTVGESSMTAYAISEWPTIRTQHVTSQKLTSGQSRPVSEWLQSARAKNASHHAGYRRRGSLGIAESRNEIRATSAYPRKPTGPNDVPIVRSSIPKISPSVGNGFVIWIAVILCEGSVLATPKKNTLALLLLVVRHVMTVAVPPPSRVRRSWSWSGAVPPSLISVT